jgi:hypothetical protein
VFPFLPKKSAKSLLLSKSGYSYGEWFFVLRVLW